MFVLLEDIEERRASRESESMRILLVCDRKEDHSKALIESDREREEREIQAKQHERMRETMGLKW
jgi:hypothetical protein